LKNLNEEETNQVSFYISIAQKISLEFEVIYYKNLEGEEGKHRNTINKNILFILESFVDKYINNIQGFKDVVLSTVVIPIDSKTTLNNKNMMRDMSSYQRKLIAYPLKLSKSFMAKFELFIKRCEEELNFNFSKTTFYNIILLDYYLHNKADIAKWQMEHWTQDYYQKRDVENNKLEDVLKYVNTILDE
jgi:hypothetical protein